ncbi:hypothetical protein L204_102684 [Cryptococcus depauperatus]
MVVSDIVKITAVVVSPILLFTILFLATFIYRRYSSSHKNREFHPNDGIWNPTVQERVLPHCHMCHQNRHVHQSGGLEVTVEDDDQYSSLKETPSDIHEKRGETLSQPHFVEKRIDVRRLSHNPHAPDIITRVNSVASTLSCQQEAQASSELLPFGGGRRASHSSSINPHLLGYQGVEANSLAAGVVAVGDRRPSVLSGGLSDKEYSETLSVRKVSIGGAEDLVKVKPAGIDPSRLPVRLIDDTIAPESHRPSIKNDELQLEEHDVELSISHPFSATSADIRIPGSHNASARSIPLVQAPPRPLKASSRRQRPDSLKLAAASVTRKSTTSSTSLPIDQSAPLTCTSVIALKSAPSVISPKNHLVSPKGSISEEVGASSTTSLFDAWRGFPPKIPAAKAILIQSPSNTSATSESSSASASSRTVPSTSAPAALSTKPTNTLQTGDLVPAMKARNLSLNGLSPSGQRSSRITYLADVVKENEERKRSSVSTCTSLTSSPLNNVPSEGLVPPQYVKTPSKNEKSSDATVSVTDTLQEYEEIIKSAQVAPASYENECFESAHVQYDNNPNTLQQRKNTVAEYPPVISPLPWQAPKLNVIEKYNDGIPRAI